jgi:16S rRNA (cytosine1402-N4)-methyltransferase
MSHIPVLLNEVIKFLRPKPGDVILDATIDGGGHAIEILKRIMPNGKLVGIDQDQRLLDNLKSQIPNSKNNLILINDNFRNIDKILESLKIEKLDGALYDLGMSSLQLEESGRGFTFSKDEPLLMTYKFPIGPGDLTARQIINTWSEKQIADIIFRYGEERFARRIAKNICERRGKHPFKTTFELVEVVNKSVSHRFHRRINPATKTFQAIRIAVNDELNALSESLEKVWNFLIPGSRLAAISFHSLEDRVVKNFLKNKEGEGTARIETKKPIRPSAEEISLNPSSRSAKLRAALRIQ